jgi:Ran GTPase-activating protein (RanGAP) involved in mRNA processing and transport
MTDDMVNELFRTRCEDLGIPIKDVQQHKFVQLC